MPDIEFIHGLGGLRPKDRGCVATIGAFDGVHLGHQALLASLKQQAALLGLATVVVIFEPQPNEYFGHDRAPARLMRLREKVLALHAVGVDTIVCLKFDDALRSLSASDFVQTILIDGLGVRHLIVGDDFRFGCDRSGDFAFLKKMGADHGFIVKDTQTHRLSNDRISSTRVRHYLAKGDLVAAQKCLGRPYSNLGRVVYGQQLGRKLGFPTLNIGLGRLAVPLSGVFVVDVLHGSTSYEGVANVGVRPTVPGQSKPILEVHLLHVNKDFYGEFVEVVYRDKLRDENKFENIEELQHQIAKDVLSAKEFFLNA